MKHTPQDNWTTSGVKQDSQGNSYMESRNTRTGELRIIPLTTSHIKAEVLQEVSFSSVGGHNWTHTSKGYIPSVCGTFGCAVCDAANLKSRLAAFHEE